MLIWPVLCHKAQPVPTTIAVAAISPHRIRFIFPARASCEWKNGDDTVNQEGQKPANTPEASPMSSTNIERSSVLNCVIYVIVPVRFLSSSRVPATSNHSGPHLR